MWDVGGVALALVEGRGFVGWTMTNFFLLFSLGGAARCYWFDVI